MNKVTTNKKHYGRSISQIRESRAMKQEELANRIGVSQQTVSKYEQTEDLDENIIQKLAKGLGVDVDYIQAYVPDTNAKTVNNFSGNDIKGGIVGTNNNNGDGYVFHAVEHLVASHKDQVNDLKQMYERLLSEKDRQIQELKKG